MGSLSLNLRSVALGLMVVALGLYLWDPFTSEEDRVARVLSRIERDYFLSKGESKLQFAARVNALKGLFTGSATVNLKFQYREEFQPVSGRDEIAQAMIAVSTQLNEFRLKFYDTDIKIHDTSETATLQTSCEINYQADELVQASDLSMEFKKIDGEWLIQTVVNETPWEF